jgi:protein SCO1
MKIIFASLLGGCLACLPAASSFANSTRPFTILSTSSNVSAKPRMLPDFSLTERSGNKITLAGLRGDVWIADFIYMHCPDTCSLQSADMAKLQEQWKQEKQIKLVSFSVDPERDTPQVLSEYADRFKADAKRWLFLTGTKREIARLLEDGFHLPIALHGNRRVILHSPRFVLVDQRGRVRGYYDHRAPKTMQRLRDDVAKLLNDRIGISKEIEAVSHLPPDQR